MAWSLVHTASNHTSFASLTVTATTIGNLGVLACGMGSTPTPAGGGTWHQIGTTQVDTPNGEDDSMFYVVFTSSVTSITGFSAGDNSQAVCFAEFSSPGTITLDTDDTSHAFATPSGGVYTSNAITPSQAGELILGCGYDNNGATPTLTAGSGYTLAIAEPGSSITCACCIEYNLSGGAGSTTATVATTGTGTGVVQIAAFLPGSGAAVLPQNPVVVDFAVPRAANY